MPPRPSFSGRPEPHFYDTTLKVRPPADRSRVDEAPPAKKQRLGVEMRASAYVLAHYSTYFAAALSKEWGGEAKELEVTAEVEPFTQLLHFCHGLGDADSLPEGAAAKARLLSVAHEFGVEKCIAAAATSLAAEASELGWDVAMQALSLASGKACEEESAASALAAMRSALNLRMLQLLGNLDRLLNSEAQLEQFCQLPVAVLEELFASDDLQVDCEETVFCALAFWMHHRRDDLTEGEQQAAAAALLPHVRFACMRPCNVVQYWHAFSWFREYDSNKEVLVEALAVAADPHFTAFIAKWPQGTDLAAKLRLRPSCKKQLHLNFVSELDVASVSEADLAAGTAGSKMYWAGGIWSSYCEVEGSCDDVNSKVNIGFKYKLPPGECRAAAGMLGSRAVGPVVAFTLAVAKYSGGRGSSWLVFDYNEPRPMRTLKPQADSYKFFWRNLLDKFKMPNGSSLNCTNFRSQGSPLLHNGKMELKLDLAMKSGAPAMELLKND